MRVFIFSGGTIDRDAVRKEYESRKPDQVIAADRGLIFCHAEGIRPDIIVGDFDSLGAAEHRPENTRPLSADEQTEERKKERQARDLLETYRQAGIPIRQFRPEKDMTDTDIATEQALEASPDEVLYFGATGTRLDHTLSNIFNLRKLYAGHVQGVILDAHNRITAPVGGHFTIRKDAQYGNYVSLFPLGGDVTGVTLKGFAYPLDHAAIQQGDGGLAVSNEIIGETGEITWETGILLVMETRD